MRFGIWIVAGILEKSKRLRNPFLFAIRNTPKLFCAAQGLRVTAEPGQNHSSRHSASARTNAELEGLFKKDTQMRLRGQHVPEAPCTAHGQMSFVCFAPVCLFPVPPPAGQLLNRVEPPSIRFPGFVAEGRYLDE